MVFPSSTPHAGAPAGLIKAGSRPSARWDTALTQANSPVKTTPRTPPANQTAVRSGEAAARMPSQDSHDKILIVDFGSQVTQLIARRVREERVYCEIVPYQKAAEAFLAIKPKAVILSGGPASVLDKDAPLRAEGALRGGRAGARHLLRRAGDGASARRRGRGRPPPRIRPRRGAGDRGHAAVRGRLEEGREISGLDEPWRPGDPAAEGLPRGWLLAERADRHDRRREAQILRHAIPSRGGAHAAGRSAAAQFRAQDRRLPRRLDHARLQGRGDRADPQRRSARAG